MNPIVIFNENDELEYPNKSYLLSCLLELQLYTYYYILRSLPNIGKYVSIKLETIYFVISMRKYKSIICILVDNDIYVFNEY